MCASCKRQELRDSTESVIHAVCCERKSRGTSTSNVLPKAHRNLKSCFLCSHLVSWEQVTADHWPAWRRTQVTLSIYTIRDPEWHLILSSETTSREVLFLFLVYKWDWGTERLSNLTRVTEVVIGKDGVWTKVLPMPEPVLLCYLPENCLCFWTLCLSFCCTIHLKRLSCYSYLFSQPRDKNVPHPPSCVLSEGFLNPPNWLRLLPPLNSKIPGAPLGLAGPFYVIKPA